MRLIICRLEKTRLKDSGRENNRKRLLYDPLQSLNKRIQTQKLLQGADTLIKDDG